MRSVRTARFAQAYTDLPMRIQKRAKKQLRLFADNTRHNSLHFKKVHSSEPIYSLRVGLDYRMVGQKDGDTMIWFWIGPHDEYERLLNRL